MTDKSMPLSRLSAPPSAEEPSTERWPSPEWVRAEEPSSEAGSSEPRPEKPRPDPIAVDDSRFSVRSELGELSERARELLGTVPAARPGRSAWLRAVARDEEITLHLARHLGLQVKATGELFPCVLHEGCAAVLTRGRNGEIVYHDGSLACLKREFQTIVELAVALKTRTLPRRLRPLQIALWKLRLMAEAGLLELPAVAVPQVAPGSPACVQTARDGFELLIRCRWFLDAGEPVTFTRGFLELWCEIPKGETRRAIFELLRQGVIVKVGEIPSAYPRAAHLYLPGTPTTFEMGRGLEQ
jgi:hypothetical protein